MDWESVWKIVLAVITSIGGAGVIICGVAKFLSEKIADRMQAKYELKLNEKFEEYKSVLDNITYVTKAQFDNEFSVYQKLSKAFYHAYSKLGSFAEEADTEDEISYKNRCYPALVDDGKSLAHKFFDARDALYENAPFISKDIYEKYEDTLKRMEVLFMLFINRMIKMKKHEVAFEDLATIADKEACDVIGKELKETNIMVREYLQSLQIIQ